MQNDVKQLSISGRRGELDELERSLLDSGLKVRLSKSEDARPSDSNDLIQTEKLLQGIAALLPNELWYKHSEHSKTYTYSAKATFLKDFRSIFDAAVKQNDDDFKNVYKFYLDRTTPPPKPSESKSWKKNKQRLKSREGKCRK